MTDPNKILTVESEANDSNSEQNHSQVEINMSKVNESETTVVETSQETSSPPTKPNQLQTKSSDSENSENENSESQSTDFNWKKAIPNPSQTEYLDIQHRKLRTIPDDALKGLDKCEYVCFRYNLIKDMSPVINLSPTALTELDLYDNNIKYISGIESLVNLITLDLSYNNIKEITGLSKLNRLEKLYLCSNKISIIKELEGLESNLIVLELGSNRIKTIQNLPNFKVLKELHLAKNKISKIENLPCSINETLKILTLQENRISKIENLENLINLEEVYLGSNLIVNAEQAFDKNANLTMLDLSCNKSLENLKSDLEYLDKLTDLWLNSCDFKSWQELDYSLSFLKEKDLNTVYLEHNPIQENDASYRRKLKLILPKLIQIDATQCV